jgi:3-hydroxyacyl-[acyl-carrier-protein] dehydratase
MDSESVNPYGPVGIDQILFYMPHRHPFLLIDRIDRIISEENKLSVVAKKNVTVSEPFFQGHFPERPIMPGVLILEAMAQSAAFCFYPEVCNTQTKIDVYLLGVNKSRFRKMVRPGDCLEIHTDLIKKKGKFVVFSCRALCEAHEVADAEIMTSIEFKELGEAK